MRTIEIVEMMHGDVVCIASYYLVNFFHLNERNEVAKITRKDKLES